MKQPWLADLGESNDADDNSGASKENVTERLAATRQVKFNQLWTEFMNKLSDLNQVLIANAVRRIFYFIVSLESDQRIGEAISRMQHVLWTWPAR